MNSKDADSATDQSQQQQQPSPGWYPDTSQPDQQRYWDGAQWTSRTAPLTVGTVPAPPSGSKKERIGTGVIVAIVLGIVVLLGLVVAVTFAFSAVSIYQSGSTQSGDSAARADASMLGREVATHHIDNDGPPPDLSMSQGAYEFTTDDRTWGITASEGVSLGGVTGTGATDWCVWVSAPDSSIGAARYSAQNGLEDGRCG